MTVFIGISGKICSGKDTVASEIASLVREKGKTVHVTSYAKLLKEEVNEIINYTKHLGDSRETTSKILSFHFKVSLEEASKALELVIKASKVSSNLSAYERTEEIRQLMQFWGTEVRRKENPNYWVEKTISQNFHEDFVIVTDCRYSNELEAVLEKDGYVLRLEVSPETQLKRIIERDGEKEIDLQRLQHTSEISLDDYNFKNRFDTEKMSAKEIAQKVISEIGVK